MSSDARVRPLTPFRELRAFFEYVYGEKVGYVYAPTKNPNSSEWVQNFFRWPEQKRELIEHFTQETTLELYYSPALWSTNRISRDSFLGVRVVWAEMDYGIPTEDLRRQRNVPAPSLRIRSSTEDHQHWYWKLDYFENSPDDLETVTKRIAYAVDADLSCWDYQQVLRPPTTIHQESGNRVTILERTQGEYGVGDFLALPDPPQGADNEVVLDELPDAQMVIAMYQWKQGAFETFRQPKAVVHKRSDTLCYLAYECAEMGMNDAEIMAILINADDRWGKFKGRDDRYKHLQGIILRARHKYPVTTPSEAEDDFPIFGFNSFLKQEYHLEWFIDGLVPKKTIVMTSGRPSIGKSQFNLQAAIHLALGEDYLNWEIEEAKKSIFFSMEMGPEELHEILGRMALDLDDDQIRQVEKNLLIIPVGEAVLLNNKANQAKIMRVIEKYDPAIVHIDSLGVAIGDNLGDDKVINGTMDFVKRGIINQFGCSVWFIHHNRKPQIGNKHPKYLEDLYGSQYIGGHIVSGVGLWKDKPEQEEIEVNCLKSRLGKPWDTFNMVRTENLNYSVLGTSGTQEPPQGGGRRRGARTRPGRIGI